MSDNNDRALRAFPSAPGSRRAGAGEGNAPRATDTCPAQLNGVRCDQPAGHDGYHFSQRRADALLGRTEPGLSLPAEVPAPTASTGHVLAPKVATGSGQALLPEVIGLGDNRWMVASKTYAPGAYWPLSVVNVDGATVYRCACPAGVRYSGLTVAQQARERGCRHLVVLVRFQNALTRRPAMSINVGSFVD